MILAIQHDSSGEIYSIVSTEHGPALEGYLDQPNTVFMEHDELLLPEEWRYDIANGELVRKPPVAEPAPNLAEMKLKLQRRLDDEAETARLRYITPGNGQMLEYRETEDEAKRMLAGEAGPFPMLEADRAARIASGDSVSLQQVAENVKATADLWRGVAATIKRKRREAKLKIENAETLQQARAAARIDWP